MSAVWSDTYDRFFLRPTLRFCSDQTRRRKVSALIKTYTIGGSMRWDPKTCEDLKIREVREAARCLRQGDPIEAVAMALKTNIRTLCEALTLANEVLKSDGAKLTLMEMRTVVKMQVDLVKTSVISKLYGIPPHQIHRQIRVYTMSEPTSP